MKKYFLSVFVLSFVGFIISSYLAFTSSHDIVACATSACELVTNSHYASLFGVPVAWIGAAGFALLAAFAGLGMLAQDKKFFLRMIFTLATGGLALVAYLVYVELFRLNQICAYCTATHIIGALIWILALVAVIKK